MELDTQTTSQELSGVANDRLHMPVICGLCRRTLSLEDEVSSGLHSVCICDDCKFLLLEDFGTPVHNSSRRRLPGSSLINGNSDSVGNFSQQFSQIINLARHVEPECEDANGDTNLNTMMLQLASSRTTPNGSSRWRRILSDTESDGFNTDSFYGESESNFSGGAYRIYHGDSDAISFSTYDGDSVASVDDPTHFDTDIYVQSLERSGIDSDTDIDPMHAGVVHWNSDDFEVEDSELGENDVRLHDTGTYVESSAGSDYFVERSSMDSLQFEEMISQRLGEVRYLQNARVLVSIDDWGEVPHADNSEDFVEARQYEELLDRVHEANNIRRRAPPAAVSSIDYLPLVVISDEHHKNDGLACAICKDLLMVGTKVTQLPCFHLYHPTCILPWLRARNNCPLCRYELPTGDRDYDWNKRNANHGTMLSEFLRLRDRGDSSSVATDSSEINDAQNIAAAIEDVGIDGELSHTNVRRGGWLLRAAAPMVGLLGIAIVLWLGNPLPGRSSTWQSNLHDWPAQPVHSSGFSPRNQQEKRWWWF